jgi:D-lactate dehydrogenase (cytochrome)
MTALAQLASRLPGLDIGTGNLELYASDVYYRAEAMPLAVVRPRSEAEIVELVGAAREMRLALHPRGAGLSYSSGYLATHEASLIVDLAAMDRVLELNAADRYVTVEPGVTWATLRDMLRPLGLTTPFWGTFSGLHATIGGSVSQGAKFFGSASRGSSAETVLGLRVVTGRAECLATGSSGSVTQSPPFFRNYGPDLTGMFLGDCGAFGIKTAITLQLVPAALAEGYCSYTFEDGAAQMQAMAAVGADLIASECLGIDPFTASQRLRSEGLLADIRLVGNLIRGGRTLLHGLRDAAMIAARGRRFVNRLGYLMNSVVEGRDAKEVASKLSRIQSIAIAHGGTPVADSIPRAMRSMPFPPMNSLLTPSGKRMAWLHVVVPNSQGSECFRRTEAVFARHAAEMKQRGVSYGYLLSTHGPSGVGVETLLRWADAPLEIHLRYMTEAQRARFKRHADNPEARALLKRLSDDLLEAWAALGGVHLQIGRKYPFMESRQEPVRGLLDELKRLHDPDGIMSPGNLFAVRRTH